MPVDNSLYDQMAETWWDEDSFLSILRTALNPVRFGYFRKTLESLHIDPQGKRALDIGCGGGLLAEEFARLGCRVTGIDPSLASLDAARAHAARMALAIEYRPGAGEQIPFDDAAFDIAYCCDVLEHVEDLDKVIAETARVLKRGGIYFYDTINRTPASRLVAIKVFQDWSWTSFLPRTLHDWNMFIRPEELRRLMNRYGLEYHDVVGIQPGVNRLAILRALRDRKRGRITYAEMGRRLQMTAGRNVGTMYMGYALKSAGTV